MPVRAVCQSNKQVFQSVPVDVYMFYLFIAVHGISKTNENCSNSSSSNNKVVARSYVSFCHLAHSIWVSVCVCVSLFAIAFVVIFLQILACQSPFLSFNLCVSFTVTIKNMLISFSEHASERNAIPIFPQFTAKMPFFMFVISHYPLYYIIFIMLPSINIACWISFIFFSPLFSSFFYHSFCQSLLHL